MNNPKKYLFSSVQVKADKTIRTQIPELGWRSVMNDKSIAVIPSSRLVIPAHAGIYLEKIEKILWDFFY
jgi:hypothetical protein